MWQKAAEAAAATLDLPAGREVCWNLARLSLLQNIQLQSALVAVQTLTGAILLSRLSFRPLGEGEEAITTKLPQLQEAAEGQAAEAALGLAALVQPEVDPGSLAKVTTEGLGDFAATTAAVLEAVLAGPAGGDAGRPEALRGLQALRVLVSLTLAEEGLLALAAAEPTVEGFTAPEAEATGLPLGLEWLL